ncbi:hypothetical protein IFU25_08060 [Pantoea agglomerans]|uniref:hypothetical protein n=1 Tax=Enterobacter agglomerans TaxID=549 RepID=UPI00178487CC|nr:hypothetical protein [Pantoea agglomerans]MBD8181655.1 hypothetical protein [Pantoea agglomerans]
MEKKYDMPAITESQRETLIAYCISRIEHSAEYSRAALALRIALAALTARPVEHLTWHQGCRAPDDCEDYTVVAAEGDKSCDGSEAFPVYMAPPVTEIKLPAEADGSNLPFAAMSWNACLAEVKRLNGVTK